MTIRVVQWTTGVVGKAAERGMNGRYEPSGVQ
jgi:hypothetical protein